MTSTSSSRPKALRSDVRLELQVASCIDLPFLPSQLEIDRMVTDLAFQVRRDLAEGKLPIYTLKVKGSSYVA